MVRDFLVEARACEVLRHSPHPNVARVSVSMCRVIESRGSSMSGASSSRGHVNQ